MSLYKPWYVTNTLTTAVQSAGLSGNKVTFKYMIASRDKIDDKDLSGLTNDLLKTIKVDDKSLVSSSDVTNNDATVVAVFTDRGVKEEHELNTLLLIAEYNGKEFLAGVMLANTPHLMPKENDNEHAEYTFRAVLSISNTAVVNVELNPEAVATNESVNKVKNDVVDIRKVIDDTLAKVNTDNEFLGKTIFDSDVTVKGALHGTSDWALNSNYSIASKTADYAKKLIDGSNINANGMVINGSANLNGDTTTEKLDVNKKSYFHEDALFFNGAHVNWGLGIDGILKVLGQTVLKDLTVDGTTKLNGDLVTKKVDFMGGGYFHENVDVTSDLDVHGKFTSHADAHFLNGLSINAGGFGVTGDSHFNGRIYATSGLSISGDTVTKKIDVNGPLLVHGDVQVDGHLNGTNTREVVHMGIGDVIFWRFGHTVYMFYDGYYGDTGHTLPWGGMSGFNVPAGYRPAERTLVTVCNNWKTSHANIDLGGNLQATETEYSRNTNIEIQGMWQTNDDFRI